MPTLNARTVSYVDAAAKGPSEPLVRALATADPDRLAAILAAIGLEVRRTAVYVAHAVGAELSLVSATASAPAVKDKFYFLVPSAADVCRRAAAAGAVVVKPPQPTQLGIRAAIQDHDGRIYILIEQPAATESTPARPNSLQSKLRKPDSAPPMPASAKPVKGQPPTASSEAVNGPKTRKTAARVVESASAAAPATNEKSSSPEAPPVPTPRPPGPAPQVDESVAPLLRRFDFGLIALLVLITLVVVLLSLFSTTSSAGLHLRLRGSETWIIGGIWIISLAVVAFVQTSFREAQFSAAVRRSLVMQRHGLNVCLIGLIVATFTVVLGLGILASTTQQWRAAKIGTLSAVFFYSSMAGFTIITVGRAISFAASRRILDHLLLLVMLVIDVTCLGFLWDRDQLSLYAFILSTTLFAAYLERAAAVFALERVRLIARLETVACLVALSVQMVVLMTKPWGGMERPNPIFEVASYSVIPCGCAAYALQILLIGRFAKEAKDRLENAVTDPT